MTLDADTRMTRDAVTRLAGKLCASAQPAAHRRRDRPRRRAAIRILQPRVTASLTTGDEASFFQRVFSANRGLDPYVFAVSDLYQDVFGEGTFTGKGLYHIDAVEAALKGRIAENAVLSHDLLEGALARAALVTDVEVVEDYPTRYSRRCVAPAPLGARRLAAAAATSSTRASGVPALSRWKMIDNLRRSLTPIFWVMAAIAGWTLLPFTQAAQWQALLILSLFMAPTFDIVDAHPAEEPAKRRCAAISARCAATPSSARRMVALRDRADGAFGLADGRRDRAHALPAVRQPPATCSNGAPPRRRTSRRQHARSATTGMMYGAVVIAAGRPRHSARRRLDRRRSSPSSSRCSGPARRPSPG